MNTFTIQLTHEDCPDCYWTKALYFPNTEKYYAEMPNNAEKNPQM